MIGWKMRFLRMDELNGLSTRYPATCKWLRVRLQRTFRVLNCHSEWKHQLIGVGGDFLIFEQRQVIGHLLRNLQPNPLQINNLMQLFLLLLGCTVNIKKSFPQYDIDEFFHRSGSNIYNQMRKMHDEGLNDGEKRDLFLEQGWCLLHCHWKS